MTRHRTVRRRLAELILLAASLFCLVAADGEESPPIIQPGAPGQPGRHISAEEASDLAAILFSDADVKLHAGHDPASRPGARHDRARRGAERERRHARAGAAHRALAARRDRDDGGVAPFARPGGPRARRGRARRGPRSRREAHAGDADSRGDAPPGAGARPRVRSAVSRAHDRPPPGRSGDGRHSAFERWGGPGVDGVRLHHRRHRRSGHGDRSHGVDARSTLERSADRPRRRLPRCRHGGTPSRAGRLAAEAAGILQSRSARGSGVAAGEDGRRGRRRRRRRRGRQRRRERGGSRQERAGATRGRSQRKRRRRRQRQSRQRGRRRRRRGKRWCAWAPP